MTVTVILRRRAEQDIEIARDWYDAQQGGLGEKFLALVQERLEVIRQFPEACPAIYRKVRRAVVQQFPYLIFYLVSPDKVVVLAVLHTSRSPAKLAAPVKAGKMVASAAIIPVNGQILATSPPPVPGLGGAPHNYLPAPSFNDQVIAGFVQVDQVVMPHAFLLLSKTPTSPSRTNSMNASNTW